jgi:small subunit ribosomal protein S8
MPDSKFMEAFFVVLQEDWYIGYLSEFERVVGKKQLVVELKYYEGQPVIAEIDRASRPGLRHYSGKDDIPSVRAGLGVAIVSTSKGVMTDRAARAAGVGGEVLCTVF